MVHRSESELNLDNIVFEKRNKSYGAYQIRNIYNNHLLKAIAVAGVVFTGALLGPKVYKNLFPEPVVKEEEFKIQEIVLEDPPPIDPKTPPPPPPPKLQIAMPEPPKVASKEFLPPKVVDDKKVLEEKVPPTTTELENSNPGEKDQEGENPNLNEHIETGPTNVEAGDAEEAPLLFVGEESQFQGDYKKFLQKNLRYPQRALDKEVQGKVHLKFIVEKDGSITDIQVVKKLGHGCDEEAIRVVRLTNMKWSVAKNNGKPVRAYKNLAIDFKMLMQD